MLENSSGPCHRPGFPPFATLAQLFLLWGLSECHHLLLQDPSVPLKKFFTYSPEFLPHDVFLSIHFSPFNAMKCIERSAMSSLTPTSEQPPVCPSSSSSSLQLQDVASDSYGLPHPDARADRSTGNFSFLRALICSCHSLVTAEQTFCRLHLKPSYTPQQFVPFASHADDSQNTSPK